MRIYLQHVEGSKKGQTESFDLAKVRIGRRPDNELAFDPKSDLEVSGYHAEIAVEGDDWAIKDLQSRNGTYLNSRRIDQPTRLADGDVIQFSRNGPKVVFSRSDRSGSGGTAAIQREAATPYEARKTPRLPIPHLLLVIGAAVLVLAGLVFAAWWSWTAFLVVLLVVVLVASSGFFAWWWRRRRVARSSARTDDKTPLSTASPGELDELSELRERWAAALTRLRSSNLQQRGEDAVYALPWFLVLGEHGCGKTAAIRAANPLPPLSSRPGSQGLDRTRTCEWWFFDKTVLLDTPGRYSFPAEGQVDEKEWRAVLALLKRHRGNEPINGVLVAVGADVLLSRSVERLREEADRLRRRLDEMVRALGTSFPVYLLVTKTDLIAGFTEFFTHLPDTVRGQAMGSVNEDLDRRVPPTSFLDEALASTCAQLHRLRLTLLEEERGSEVGRRLFLFPEELRSLRAPLKVYVDALFRQTPYEETPLLRGLFFVSARQQGSPLSRLGQMLGFRSLVPARGVTEEVFFARDLFSVILPGDRAVVRRTAHWHKRYRRARRAGLIAGGVISLLVCGLLTLSFIGNRLLVSHLDVAECVSGQGAQPVAIAQRLKALDGCRRTIVGLDPDSFWERAALDFGLRQAQRIEAPLKERFMAAFRAQVLDPIEAHLDQKLVPGPAAPVYVNALIQRINVLAHCRKAGACPGPTEELRRGYRIMLATEYPGIEESDPMVATLRRADGAYLSWQPDARASDEMRARAVQRVMRWLGSGGLRPEWILASASSQFPAVRYRDFWAIDAGPQVDSPYTRRAWAEGIQPLLAGLKDVAPDVREVRESLARFEVDYRTESLRQWGLFLASFLQPERVVRVKGGDREMARKVLGPDSPYARVVDVAAYNLGPVVANALTLPLWADTLRRYTALQARVAESKKGGKPKAEDGKGNKGDAEDREAAAYLTGYQEALEHLRGEITSPEKSFRSAQKALEEGEATDKAAHPIHRAVWNLQRLRGAFGSRQEDDRMVWDLLLRPVQITSRVMLDEAGVYLQQQWDALWPELTEVSPGQKVGKVMGFASNGPAALFLEARSGGYTARRLLGQSTPFTPPFLEYLSRSRWISPDNPGRLEPPRQIVAQP